MNQRLQQFLAAENISQSQFADRIGVARANISHILAGRNRPGFDFLERIARSYPDLSLEWLITGRGRMFNPAKSALEAAERPIGSDTEEIASGLFDPLPSPQNTSSITKVEDTQNTKNQKYISKIVVFYSDGSFQELE